jgi:hypothetical protein
MQHEITKLCADSLRAFTSENYGIQLKSSHAHELVAAYFGYGSRAALLADINYPISAIQKAHYFVLSPTAPIDERRKQLEGLPIDLPNDLAEGVYLPLIDKGWLPTPFWSTLEQLADFLVDEEFKQKSYFFNDQRVQRKHVTIERYDETVHLTVFREYVSPSRVMSGIPGTKGVVDIFTLMRMAGHIGYGKGLYHHAEGDTLPEAIKIMEDGIARDEAKVEH